MKAAGFTLVELVVTLMIVSVLAFTVVPRFFDRKGFDSRAFHDEVLATLRYAQKAAIAQHRFVCVTFPTNQSIVLTMQETTVLPNDCSLTLKTPAEVAYPSSTIASISGSTASFSFDCLGRLSSMTSTSTGGQCADSTRVLTTSRTVQIVNAPLITVEKETGYVHAP